MSDLISRADALMELNGVCSNWEDDAKVAEIINALPSAKPKVVRVEYSPFTVEETSTPSQTSFRGTQEVKIIEIPSADRPQGWIPLSHDDDGMGTDFPYERDGEWVIVTDGKNISVERIKKDAYDHFFPNGRWFELEDVIAWMPLPKPYKGGDDE